MKDLATLAPCNAPDWPTLPVVSHVIAEEDWRQLLRRAGHGAASSITEEATTSNRVLGNPPGETFVPIFKLDELAKLGRMAELAGSEGVCVSNWLARAMSTSGLREVRIPAEVANPGMLRECFPNFGAVIDYLEIQLALARYPRNEVTDRLPASPAGCKGFVSKILSERAGENDRLLFRAQAAVVGRVGNTRRLGTQTLRSGTNASGLPED